jgi:hypothetical protein
MTDIPKINEINTAGIVLKAGRRFYYNNKPLIVQTGLVVFPYGISDVNKLRFQLSETGMSKLNTLDEMVEEEARVHAMDHIKITSSSSGGWLNITVGPWTRFFDSNKAQVDFNDGSLSSEFTGSLLLDVSKIATVDDKLMLSITVNQVLIRVQNQLPQGCKIFTNVSDLRQFLDECVNAKVNANPETGGVEEMLGDASLDSDVNELLD